MSHQVIHVKGICVHNVQHVDLILHAHELIVFTGVSGSGKSSVAFDTLFIEGERRYVESLSPFMRRAIGEFAKPDVESVSGLSPTLAIEQKRTGYSRRSTVGTVTEIYDYLRLLFAHAATPHCPVSGEPVISQTKEEILQALKKLPEGTRWLLLAPVYHNKKGFCREEVVGWLHKGFSRARINGQLVDLEDVLEGGYEERHDVALVVDRLTCRPDQLTRWAEGVTMALELGQGTLIVAPVGGSPDLFYATYGYAPQSQRSYPHLESHDFSFNNPVGMCTLCHGLGMLTGDKAHEETLCPDCSGSRLKPYPSAARLSGKGIQELCEMPIERLLPFFHTLGDERLTTEKDTRVARAVREELAQEIIRRLQILQEVGLSYLSLSRPLATLSGGEAQRVHLSAQLGSGLVGITYILDEPSVGLHPTDNRKLIRILQRLRDKGNTVIVVEHDEEMIWAADRVVDFGPGPGVHGGKILVNGSHEALLAHPDSWTGKYLSGQATITLPLERRKATGRQLILEGATHHNLQNVTVTLPLGCLIAVTGVSGSGKSSLILETLYPALCNALHRTRYSVGAFKRLVGKEPVKKVIAIDQSPLGKTVRSNPATYLNVFDTIRQLFAQLPDSIAAGYTAQTFSFNTGSGACPTCAGIGRVCIDRDFLPDQWVDCPSCHNRRFSTHALSIYYKGKNIHEVLSLTVDEALAFFATIPTLKRKLELLQAVGMGYITLGQPASTLSGGEAQRIKLAAELARPSRGETLYILDEPTSGLHLHDIHALLQVLQRLVDRGNTVVVVEHHMEVVKTADWVVDLGPGGGEAGGFLIGEGPPEEIATLATPTGEALRRVMERRLSKVASQKSALKAPEQAAIVVKGAAEHNLKKLDLAIPRNQWVVCTGPSGSGKSSFAVDTVYTEGARRYIDALTPYARQFVTPLPKAKCASIEGLSPAIAIEKRASASNPRSSVGTLTEAYDYLRLLVARGGEAYAADTGARLQPVTQESVVQQLGARHSGRTVTILAPLTLPNEEAFVAKVAQLRRKGYLRIRVDGVLYELDAAIPFDPHTTHQVALVIDRLRLQPSTEGRLREALDQAGRWGKTLLVQLPDEELLLDFSAKGAITGTDYLLLLEGQSLEALTHLPLTQLIPFLEPLAVEPALVEVKQQLLNRLHVLEALGVGYLSLDRTAPTLSSGEWERVRLSKQLGGGLTGMLYVLDEPTRGLHPHDKEQLTAAFRQLKALGNTLLLVEQDPQMIAEADYIFDFGPGSGPKGGSVVAQGSYQELLAHPDSLTGAYLSGRKEVARISPPREAASEVFMIAHASIYNLHDLSCSFPLQRLTALTGISGSGKSTLLHEVIQPLALARLADNTAPFQEVVVIDQHPLGHTARSDVGTYLQLLPFLRRFYAQLAAARVLGLEPSHFSYNHRKGMCTSCRGLGYQKVNLRFLPPLTLPCTTCAQLRLNPLSLSVTYQGKNFGELLAMTIEEVRAHFPALYRVTTLCDSLCALGLGYLTLGQEIATLSSGEAQRVKLGRGLATTTSKKRLYLLDEPTAGLHLDEISKLLMLFHRLVDEGHTVVLIEHHLEVIRQCDYLLDLGPGAGEAGGRLVCAGTPEAVARHPDSLTGAYLRGFGVLKRGGSR